MVRTFQAVLAGLLLAALGAVQAGDDKPGGTYKLTFTAGGQPRTFWLVQLESKDGKWSGKVLSTPRDVEDLADSTLDNLTVSGQRLRFTIKIRGNEFPFEGQLPKETGKRIYGVLTLNNRDYPAQLDPTKLPSLDSFEVNKEIVSRPDVGPELFEAAFDLLEQAGEKKATVAEVRAWAAKVFKAAEPYGPRWQRDTGLRITQALASQEAYLPVAVEYARQTARLMEPGDDLAVQLRVLGTLAGVLREAKKADEAKEAYAQMDKLVAKDYQDYSKKMLQFKPEPFAGRKTKSDRAVLVELFTGAQCPPCVAADLAFDALQQSYKPADVILLQYHLHIPGPDPLTNSDTEARARYYDEEIEGTPTIFFNGKARAGGGGGVAEAKDKYNEYRKVIEPLLETPAAARLKASAVRKGDRIDITAEASDVEKPGEKMRLRLALVEEQVRYAGRNGLRYHHHVVRALPGGVNGLALTAKTGKQTASVDLGELRKTLNKYLTDYGRKRPFPNNDRPMDLRKLSVVAFVQNDQNQEVLQAVQVPVTEAAGGAEK
jgi:hypothetical protein